MPKETILTQQKLEQKLVLDEKRRYFFVARIALGLLASDVGATAAAHAFNVKRHVARYWLQKLQDPDFHNGPWGGFCVLTVHHRWLKFGEEVDKAIQQLLWFNIRLHPDFDLRWHTELLNQVGADMSKSFVACIFHSWRWSWKKPTTQQINKFKPENVEYYAQWVTIIPTFPFYRLKFCDEAHFVSRNLYCSRAVGPVGSDIYLTNGEGLNESFSLTLLLDPSDPHTPFHFRLRANSNTELDFLNFVISAIEHGRLTKGDFFIVDNATIHFASETWRMLVELLDAYKVNYVFLPKYSPELNPCELVFAYVKNYIRNQRDASTAVTTFLFHALASLRYVDVLSFYQECVHIVDRIVQ